ncbi:MAG: hypothetical protein F4X58_00695 [Chloroflexi bacterium]|nr:hypothetical protein [Chloroflexota bacterium]MYC00423.1 hypothetical protein [Chloroflexota bacterium]
MQVAAGVRRWMVVLTAVTLVLFGGVVTTAQSSDPIVRFFGFSGDVTINGEPVGPGTVIAAMVGDEEIGSTTVNQAGAWILDLILSDLDPDSCSVAFVVDGLRAPEEWHCGEPRVRIALVREGQDGDSSSASDSLEESEEDESVESQPDDANGENGSQLSTEQDDGDEVSTESDGDKRVEQSQKIVRPGAPSTGTGGVLDAEESTNWPRAVAITALLTFGIALVALLMGGRTNSSQ